MSLRLMVDMSTDVNGSVELNEASGEKTYVISGQFSTPGKKNRNGRVYSKAIWESNVSRYQDEIKNNTNNTLMELEHPPRTSVDPWEAVAKIRKLEMRNGNVYGEAVILNNGDKKTNQIKALIEAGVKIGVSTRGTGKMKGDIVEEYNLITVDIVSNPSDYNANLEGFNESMILEGVEIESNGKGGWVCTPAGCTIASVNESNSKKNTEDIITSKKPCGCKAKELTEAFEAIARGNRLSEAELIDADLKAKFVELFGKPMSEMKSAGGMMDMYIVTDGKEMFDFETGEIAKLNVDIFKDKPQTYINMIKDEKSARKEASENGMKVKKISVNTDKMPRGFKPSMMSEDISRYFAEDLKTYQKVISDLGGYIKDYDEKLYKEFDEYRKPLNKLLNGVK